MNQIWKYEINHKCNIEMPENSEILTLKMQLGKPCIWVKVEPANKLVTRKFAVLCTGQSFNDDHLRYVGTFLTDFDRIVLHLFEVEPF